MDKVVPRSAAETFEQGRSIRMQDVSDQSEKRMEGTVEE